MTTEATSIDETQAGEPAPATLAQRLDVLATKASYTLSLTMLASPFVLAALAPATPSRAPAAQRSEPAVTRTHAAPGAPRSPAVAAWMAGDGKSAASAPAVTTRPIPVIEVKVRRDASTHRAPSVAPSDPAAVTPAHPATTIQPPVAVPVTVPSAPTATAPPAETTVAPPAPPAWSETEISTALRSCLTALAPLTVEMEAEPPVRENACGLPAPISIRRIGADRVELQPPALVNCGMAAAIDDWLVKVAQPAAREAFGSPIVKLTGTSGYVCRNRNGAAEGPISEHAFGNALDVSGFVLADGRAIGVKSHWGPTAKDAISQPPARTVATSEAHRGAASETASRTDRTTARAKASAIDTRRSSLGGPPAPAESPASPAAGVTGPAADGERSKEAKFLRRVHKGACGFFGTVLGPEANEAHRDHLHIDLKGRKRTGICQ